MTPEVIEEFGAAFDDVFFLIGAAILAIELIRGLFTSSFRWRGFLDMFASASTHIPYLFFEVLVLSFAYLGFVWVSDTYVSWAIPINVWSVFLVILAADFIYYWEHRFAHQVRLFWTQHAVHHSSRYMNILVGVRFGPLEGVLSVIFHAPLVFLGFPPVLIFLGIIVVLAYQTWIHTELIGKLGILDGFLNTPANHRVHHGCDEKYIDKNYAEFLLFGIGSSALISGRREKPNYGLKRDYDSINPFSVWTSEIPQFVRDLRGARTVGEFFGYVLGRPGWRPKSLDDPTTSPHS